MERSIDRIALDLDQAATEIERRWYVWTAAGLRVHPVTWTDRDAALPAPLSGRSQVSTPRSLAVRVSRPNAEADVVLYADGWIDTAVRRPDTEAVVQASAEVDSVDAFGSLLDRVVELITWSGVRPDHRRSATGIAAPPQRATHWVVGFDGIALPIEP